MYKMNLVFSILADGLFAAIAAIGFAVISNPPKKAVLVAALLAAIGHALRFFLLKNTNLDIATATIIAAFSIGMLSIYFAKIIRCPAEVFSFPSLLPMIPGMFAYKTILALMKFLKCKDELLLQGLIVDVFRNGLTTIFILFSLVIGVSIPLFVFHKQSFMMTRHLKVDKK
ncbi:MAG: threonine/serine exporter family protein [Bacteroidales bacterium]|nr:threonine/serine exporter family protein [Bacteroidales bacterium]